MNWLYIGGVLVLAGVWILIGGASEYFPLQRPLNDVLGGLWAAALIALHTAPWMRFARRAGGAHPLLNTALHAFVAHVFIGGGAVASAMLWDGAFPLPRIPCDTPLCDMEIGVWYGTPGIREFAMWILLYAAGAAVWASVVGGAALRALGEAKPDHMAQLLRFGGRTRTSP